MGRSPWGDGDDDDDFGFAPGTAWAREQQRRRSMLSFTLLLMTITLFMDGGAGVSNRRNRFRGGLVHAAGGRGGKLGDGPLGVLSRIQIKGGPHRKHGAEESKGGGSAAVTKEQLVSLKSALKADGDFDFDFYKDVDENDSDDMHKSMRRRRMDYPRNISGVYTGEWVDMLLRSANASANDDTPADHSKESKNDEEYESSDDDKKYYEALRAHGSVRVTAEPLKHALKVSKDAQNFLNGIASGTSVLRLASLPTRVEGVHAVTGLLEFHTRASNINAIGFSASRRSTYAASVSGLYLVRTGRLNLFTNSNPESIGLQWSSGNGSTTSIRALAAVDNNNNKDEIDSNSVNRRRLASASGGDRLSGASTNKVFANGLMLQHVHSGADINRIAEHAARTTMTGTFDCFVHFDLQVKGVKSANRAATDDAETFPKLAPVQFSGKGAGKVCNASLSTTFTALHIDLPRALRKASVFTLLVTITSIAQIYLVMHQLNARSNTQAAALKVSLVSVGMQSILDSYMCLVYLTSSVVFEALFNAFATAAFFKLLLFAVFEMRLLLVVWKANRAEAFSEGWQAVRRELGVLYSRFYCALIVSIVLVWQLWAYQHALLFASFSFWVPQIVYNVVKDVHNPYAPKYIYGITLTRLITPLYLLGCPRNFLTLMFHGKSLYWSSGAMYLCFWLAVQVYMLESQQWWGARWFIPARFLPQKYSYSRKVPPNLQGEDCVVCMCEVDNCDKNEHMITPCNHLFHADCLLQWMDVKMECPTCRAKLPPP